MTSLTRDEHAAIARLLSSTDPDPDTVLATARRLHAEVEQLRAECVQFDEDNTGLGRALTEARAELTVIRRERAWLLANLSEAELEEFRLLAQTAERAREDAKDGATDAELARYAERLAAADQLVAQYAPIAVPILADIQARKERSARMAAHTHYCWTCSDGTAPGDGCQASGCACR